MGGVLFVASTVAIVCAGQTDTQTALADALTTLRVAGTTREPTGSRPLDALHVLRERATPGDPAALSVLLGCVERESLQSSLRVEALRVSIRLARSGQVQDLIAVM